LLEAQRLALHVQLKDLVTRQRGKEGDFRTVNRLPAQLLGNVNHVRIVGHQRRGRSLQQFRNEPQRHDKRGNDPTGDHIGIFQSAIRCRKATGPQRPAQIDAEDHCGYDDNQPLQRFNESHRPGQRVQTVIDPNGKGEVTEEGGQGQQQVGDHIHSQFLRGLTPPARLTPVS
jgi:hypothetical protein